MPDTASRTGWTGSALRCVLGIMLLCAASCTSPQPSSNGMPSLRDIDPVGEQNDQPQTDAPPVRQARLLITALEVPVATKTRPWWDKLSQDALSAALVQRWADNGFHLGTASRDDLVKWLGDLPAATRRRALTLFASQYVEPLELTRTVHDRLDLNYIDADGVASRMSLSRGMLRFLVRLDPQSEVLEIEPQNYVPKHSVVPRSPLEKVMDGRVFTDLALRCRLMPGKVLVIAGVLPESLVATEEVEPQPPTDDAAQEESTSPVESEPAPELTPEQLWAAPVPLPATLGRWLMLGYRGDVLVQRLLLVRVVEIDGIEPGKDQSRP